LAQHATDEWRGLYGQGRALFRIREEQLYKECDPAFDDFRDFIEGALQMSKRWAYQRIDTYLVIDNLVTHNKEHGKLDPVACCKGQHDEGQGRQDLDPRVKPVDQALPRLIQTIFSLRDQTSVQKVKGGRTAPRE